MRIKAGDTVIEKATGQMMTVIDLCDEEDAEVLCSWRDRFCADAMRRFPLRELKEVNPDG